MARQRLSRKELLKQPDQFITQTAAAVAWSKRHFTHILYGVVGVLVIIGLIVGWTSWQRSRNQHAAALLQEAEQLLKTSEPPDETAVQKAVTQLETVVREYGQTPAAALAYWHLGHYHFQQGHYDAALTAYEHARQRMTADHGPLTGALITLDVAYAQEASGVCEQAIPNYEAVQSAAVPWLQGEAFLGLGRCYEQSGASSKAIAIYERALAEPQVTGETRQTISERLARLQPHQAPSAPHDDSKPAAGSTPAPAPDTPSSTKP